MFRILPLLILLQCSSVSKKESLLITDNLNCTYHKYISGAGGGKGILFRVSLADSISDFKIQKFVVNGIELPSAVSYQNGQTHIEASKFYATTPNVQGESQTVSPEPILFNATEYSGRLEVLAGTKLLKLKLVNFSEEIGEDHP